MAISHTNEIRYRYTNSGSTTTVTVTKTETSGAELNLSELFTADGTDPSGKLIAISGVEFEAKDKARSVMLKIDGFDAKVWANSEGDANLMADLFDGEPYVWSYNSAENFPEGSTNPMKDSTTKLQVQPSGSTLGAAASGTLTLEVLYDPNTNG